MEDLLVESAMKRVLIMDDESILRSLAVDILESLGYEAEAVSDGKEACKRFEHAIASGRPFDAVLLDLTIPGGVGGIETISIMKGIDPTVRSIASSGYSTDDVMETPGRFGFDAGIRKPYLIRELAKVLSDVVGS